VCGKVLRLTLQELEGVVPPTTRHFFWVGLWNGMWKSQTDYRAGSETWRANWRVRDRCWQLLEWLRPPAHAPWAAGAQARLLARVFAEQFEIQSGQAVPAPKESGRGGQRHAAVSPSGGKSIHALPPTHPTPVPAATSGEIAPSLAAGTQSGGAAPSAPLSARRLRSQRWIAPPPANDEDSAQGEAGVVWL